MTWPGTKVIGPASQVVMIAAWVFLGILVVRGVTPAGAAQGLNHYLETDWSQLASAGIWFAAFSQFAFTLSVGTVEKYAYGGFIKLKGDVTNSAFITRFGGELILRSRRLQHCRIRHAVTRLSGGGSGCTERRPLLHFMAGRSVDASGRHAFIGLIFFLCLFVLGLSSAYFLAYAGVISPLLDKFCWSRTKTSFGVCLFCVPYRLSLHDQWRFVLGADVLDRAVSFYGRFLTGALSCIVVGRVFGARRLREYANETSGFRIGTCFGVVVKSVVSGQRH